MSPHDILGLQPNASAEELRTAYLRLVKEFPPERSPEKFEQIRDAYESLRDPRRRAKAILESTERQSTFESLVANRKPRRLFVGPKAWREVLKSK